MASYKEWFKSVNAGMEGQTNAWKIGDGKNAITVAETDLRWGELNTEAGLTVM